MTDGEISTNVARLVRYAIKAARADFRRAQELPEDYRETFLDRMFQHGGYLYGPAEQQVYVRTLTNLTKPTTSRKEGTNHD